MDHILTHFKIWGVFAVAQGASFNLSELSSAFALVCSGLASLAVAFYHVTRSK